MTISAATAFVIAVTVAAIAVELYSLWLIFFASDRSFNRVYARLRARSVDWASWRQPRTEKEHCHD